MSAPGRLLLGGFLNLVVVMAIGRFYYTPLLPLMQADFGFDTATAGIIGSMNFAGYLVGSIGASLVPSGHVRLLVYRAALALSIATTLAMGLSDAVAAWLFIRFLAGVASGLAMILAAAFVAEAFIAIGEPGRAGWIFGGVGGGIAFTAVFVIVAQDSLSSSALWLVAGLFALVISPVMLTQIGPRTLQPVARRRERKRRVPRPLPFAPLLLSYSLEGLGFSVFAVFIVAIVKSRPGLESFGDWVWVAVGLAGLPSTVFWGLVAERIGFAKALVVTFLVQMVGLVLPALSDAPAAAILAAILFGGTFLGMTVLSLPLGRHGFGGRGFAVLTVGYGVGQVVGPVTAGFLVRGPADWDMALYASAGVLVVGVASLLVGIRMRDAREKAAGSAR